jgi:hypothetical protein
MEMDELKDMNYLIEVAYERSRDDFSEDNLIAEIFGMDVIFSTNMPLFDVDALNFIRTLEGAASHLDETPAAIASLVGRCRSEVPGLRAVEITGDRGAPQLQWRDVEWLNNWRLPSISNDTEAAD